MKSSAWTILLGGGLLTLLIYGPRLNAPFVWDDRSAFAFNAAYEQPIPLKKFFTPDYFRFAQEYSWRPLSTLSYYAIIRPVGKSPFALRLFSLLLHLLNGVLLFAILDGWGFKKETAAWAVALFWVHPVHVETLMCAAFNKELLTAFGLLTMVAMHQKKRWGLASLGLAVALLAKETGVAGLPLVMLYDLCAGGLRQCRSRIKTYALYLFVLLLYGFMRFSYVAGLTGEVSLSLPFSERVYYALGGWIAAVRLFFFPVALRIEYFALPPESLADWIMRGSIAMGLAGIFSAAAYYLWEKNRKLAFFCLWPLPFLFVTSNLVPAGALNTRLMAERWLYVPYLGWAVVLASLLLQRRAKAPRILATALLVCWALQSSVRAQDWSQEARLWSSLEQIYPWSAKVQAGLGEAYFRHRQYHEALTAFQRAEALRDNREDKLLAHYVPIAHGIIGWKSPSLYRWLGHAEVKTGNLPQADAYFQKALALEPSDGFSYRIMTYAYARSGDFKRAKQWLKMGLEHVPQDDLLLRLKPEIEQKNLHLRITFD